MGRNLSGVRSRRNFDRNHSSPQRSSRSHSMRSAARHIMADPDWSKGDYYTGKPPGRGLAVARMVGHITYMSDESMREKFGRRLRSPDQFEVESYLSYRGYKFVDRFDANSYICITRAMDTFDPRARRGSCGAVRRQAHSVPADQLYVGLAVSALSVARNRERVAGAELRRRLLQPRCAIWARFRSWSRSRAANRSSAWIPGEHLPGDLACIR